MEFHFANFDDKNNPSLICVENKPWGLIKSESTFNCFAIVPINNGLNLLMQNVNNLDKNGEIIISHPK